ncbi:tRNA (N(6)-L-threonylcarbamoyladenosine(37)-C(2))-methylthiotransferase MtaB [Spirochaetia bacterium]|nr:tRNA (N(6)-L-threonylcarbamoyladenosine(37)-C(2))-methylthiotransferase MtaB [Spirochaetia bacterium]
MYSVAVYTLGCKLNQVESEALAAAFRQAGFPLVPWAESAGTPVDILIINTCTVTSKADQKARRLIRKALRDNPQSCVVVTGCYAQLEPEAIAALEAPPAIVDECAGEESAAFTATMPPYRGRRLFVLKGEDKSALLDLPRYLNEAVGIETAGCNAGPTGSTGLCALMNGWDQSRRTTPQAAAGEGAFRFAPRDFSFHTRGFLKIQDGCDKFCTYCRVRLARGPSVSLDAEQILAQLQALEARGCAEAVLTGVNITQYRDCGLDSGAGLGALLEYVLAGTSRISLRLSSLDPDGVDAQFAAVLANPRIRPHFHLSIQSGSETILARMGRNYDPQAVVKAAALFRSVKDDPFLACDIITGFPGETENEFQKTLALCQNTGFAWIHAFPYSKRPGTPAFSFKEPVSERDASRRLETLLELARQGRRNYVQRWVGRETTVLIESGNPSPAGYCRGTAENYLKLRVLCPTPQAPLPGTVLRCKIGKPADADNEGPDAEAEILSETL